jgi:hypothetical protein
MYFLIKHLGSLSCYFLVSEKQHFWRFISQKVRETARFLPFSYILGGMGVFDSFDSLHHHPLLGHSPRQ